LFFTSQSSVGNACFTDTSDPKHFGMQDRRPITRSSAMAEGTHDALVSIDYRVPDHYLRDPTFSRFDTILECDRHTDRRTDTWWQHIPRSA